MKAKTHLSQTKSRGGFTLVEMLVVIGMIAALAGISFPVYRSIQNKVEKQKILMMYNSIERATDNFETEYNYLPYCLAAYPTSDTVLYWADGLGGQFSVYLGVLMGLENTKNFKQIKFLEIDAAEGSGATVEPGPSGWKNGVVIEGTQATLYNDIGMTYAARVDHDGDGEIADPRLGWPTTNPMVIGKKIVLYTMPRPSWTPPWTDLVTNID